MNRTPELRRYTRRTARLCFGSCTALLATALLLLSGCGGGGGGDVTIAGNNQSRDPATVEYPIAYVRRPVPAASAPASDLRDPFRFSAGAQLLVRSRADGNADEENITIGLFPAAQSDLYDVRDLAVSPDGTRLLFALHAPLIPNADPADQTKWAIWEYTFSSKALRRIISSDNRAQQGNDVAPNYLDDGRIVFVSDRQTESRAQLASTGAPAYSALEESLQRKAGVLHVMSSDGNNLTQLSFNQSHDLWPALLQSGQLVFTRWDNMGSNDRMNLYTLNPSGMALSLLYGYHSHDTGTNPAQPVQFSQPRQMEDGRLVTILRRYQSATLGGDMVALDIARYSDHDQPTWENAGLGGSGQQSLAVNPVHTDGTLSPGGEFGAAYPLWDGTKRLLVSWSQCRQIDGDTIKPCSIAPAGAPVAPPLFGIWIYDPGAGTQRPIVTPREGVIFTDIVAAMPRRTFARAADPLAGSADGDLANYGNTILNTLQSDNLALIDIRSVYNLDGQVRDNNNQLTTPQFIVNQTDPANAAYALRRARFLQIVQGVPIPDPDDEILEVPNSAFGVSRGQLMRHIIGYVPIEPDGSVAVKVPADVPITFNILDANAQRISTRHQVWWQLRAGEVLRCAGCHDANSERPHGRLDSAPPEVNPGAISAGGGGWNFPISQPLAMRGTQSGQTLAQVYAANNLPRSLSVNVLYNDEWSVNPAQRDATLDYRYTNNDPARPRQVPVAPVTAAICETQWRPDCRIVINYVEHIQPLWDKPRPQFDNMGDPVLDGNGIPIDNRCTGCHTAPWIDNGINRAPAGQLELSGGPSNRNANFVMSYSELFTGDSEVDDTGTPVLVPQFDGNGDPVLDGDGNQVFAPVPVGASMSANGARSSPLFFGCFRNGGTCGNFSRATNDRHVGWLNPAELRLLSEWLDIGAQYYNDVVKAATAP